MNHLRDLPVIAEGDERVRSAVSTGRCLGERRPFYTALSTVRNTVERSFVHNGRLPLERSCLIWNYQESLIRVVVIPKIDGQGLTRRFVEDEAEGRCGLCPLVGLRFLFVVDSQELKNSKRVDENATEATDQIWVA